MPIDASVFKRSLLSGTVSGIATTLAAALAGKRESGSYAGPINATSHIFWGDKAGRRDDASLKFTGTGFLLNHAASIMWATVYEKWVEPAVRRFVARRPALAPFAPAISAAAVSAGAYVTDYYLVPKRFTPGYEKRLSGRSMAMVFGALAVGLVASTLIMERMEK